MDGGFHLHTLSTMTGVPILSCTRCGTMIDDEELGSGLAVRVDGELVCELCVDTLPSAAVVRINQVRALRGLEATTYLVKLKHLPRLQLYSFTTSVNITQHRRKVATDGFFEAPLLPSPAEREKIPASPVRVTTDRIARGQFPARTPMVIAAAVTLVVLGGIAIAFAVMSPTKKTALRPDTLAELPPPVPTKALKTRLDYAVDAMDAWLQAAPDSGCPTVVLQGICQELLQKRKRQLDDAESALSERRLDDAAAQLNVLALPDDIAFRQGRARESDLHARLLTARTVATLKPTVAISPAIPLPIPPPISPVIIPVPEPVTNASGEITLKAPDARITGTQLQLCSDLTLGYWFSPADSAWWSVTIPKPCRYRVTVLVSGTEKNIWLAVEIADQVLAAPSVSDQGYFHYLTLDFGVMSLAAANNLTLRLRSFDSAHWKPVNIRSVTLTPTTDEVTPAPAPIARPPAVVEKPIIPFTVAAWNGAFVAIAKEKKPRTVSLTGAEPIPQNLPGGVTQLFRSLKSASLKRHVATLDLGIASALNGGIALLIHSGRNDRKEVIPSLTDAKGETVRLSPLTLPNDEWTSVVLSLPADDSVDASQLVALTLEDVPKSAHIPDDAGFFIAKAVVVSGRSATVADLAIRPSALLADPKRFLNLKKLVDVLAQKRKKSPGQKFIEPARIRFLVGKWCNDQAWQNSMKQNLTPFTGDKAPNPLIMGMTFTEPWLDAMTKAANAPLDPQAIHIAVLWIGGEEATAFPDVQQTLAKFWDKRLGQILEAGILPIIVIGPNHQTAEKRLLAEQVWQSFVVRFFSLPVIDLRHLPTADNGAWDAATAAQANLLASDAIYQTVINLNRLGVIK